jgi:hypothetical protein
MSTVRINTTSDRMQAIIQASTDSRAASPSMFRSWARQSAVQKTTAASFSLCQEPTQSVLSSHSTLMRPCEQPRLFSSYLEPLSPHLLSGNRNGFLHPNNIVGSSECTPRVPNSATSHLVASQSIVLPWSSEITLLRDRLNQWFRPQSFEVS